YFCIDTFTPITGNAWKAARHAVDCALTAAEAVLAGERLAYALVRPPGHHAEVENAMGFCFINNIAVAVKLSGKRTLVVDIDGHHGNGTEAIFLGDPNVTYVSLHRIHNYPGTGYVSRANAINVPLPPRCGGERYVEALEEALERAGRDHEELAISVGFDTYKDDPLASLGLEVEDYYSIGYVLGGLGLPTFCVLEGGYVPEIMGPAAHAFLSGLTEGGARTGPQD
ncbi:MAG: acetylpolyamine amidohydrolase, partial [Candidatus Bipolaricaulaceae bacterium]